MPERDYLRDLDRVEIGTRFLAIPDLPSRSLRDDRGAAGQQTESLRTLVASSEALPFGEKAHSLIVVPHVLDSCVKPHNVLREINQLLVPEGCILIMGFNQFSLWKMYPLRLRGLRRNTHSVPWQGHSYRPGRVQDWLSLLGMDIVGACMMAYQLPLQSPRWRQKFGFLESMGERWWPGLGAVYMIVGRKREFAAGTTVKSLAWRRFVPAIAKPSLTASGIPNRKIGADAEARHWRVI